MFDIGFFEICLISVIALLVIGPEKLPKVARTTGLWLGKFRGMVRTVKYDIDEQIRMDELKQSLEKVKKEAVPISDDFKETFDNMQSTLSEAEADIKKNIEPESNDDTNDDKKPSNDNST